MILKTQHITSAKWDNEKNSWWIGKTSQYQWCTTIKEQPVSPWLNTIDEVLNWIIEYDRKKNEKL